MTLDTIRSRASIFVAALAATMAAIALICELMFQGTLGLGSMLAGIGLAGLTITFLVSRQSAAFLYGGSRDDGTGHGHADCHARAA
ncbi:MAG: hypothetical protein ACOH2L_03025 [Devosia sp.]